PMTTSEVLDGRGFISGVVIDMHVGILPPTFHDTSDEPFKGLLLFPRIERPDRFITQRYISLVPTLLRTVATPSHSSDQILEPLVERERISLKVEKQISTRRWRQRCQAHPNFNWLDQLMNWFRFDPPTHLYACLLSYPQQWRRRDLCRGGTPWPPFTTNCLHLQRKPRQLFDLNNTNFSQRLPLPSRCPRNQ